MDRTKMRDHFDSQAEAYRSLLKGDCPIQNAIELSSVIFSAVCGGPVPVLEEDSRHFGQPMDYSQCGSDLTCTALTLVEKINSKLTSQCLSPEASLYFMEVSRLLFQEMDLMSKLVGLFQAEDRLVSHLAAKTVSTHIFYELQRFGTVSPIWEQKCVKVFQNPGPCNELDACLWSLTSVLKMILKGSEEHQTDMKNSIGPGAPVQIDMIMNTKVMEKVLAHFDPALSALCSNLLPGERQGEGKDEKQSTLLVTNNTDWGTTLSTLLALLELLTAARSTRTTSVCLQSQRLTHAHASALLRLVHSPCNYFVKKQALLLLKRTLLQKAGEDMALGEVSATAKRDEHYTGDMATLADGVLEAVRADWLKRVPVEEAASFFGGSSQSRGEGSPTSDYVMLRAVSLVLLKSMEFEMQSADRKGVDMDVPGYLQALLLFLTQRGVLLKEHVHPCSWVTLLFGDQDDDMMEAAKALLSLHQHHSASSGLDAVTLSDSACSSGSNPHCHFLFLLRSLSFDHSILLDFLISTETCFLEYFVRYLKYLRSHWEGFSMACRRMEALDCHQLEQLQPGSCKSGGSAWSCGDEPRGEPGTGPDPGPVQPSVCGPSVSGTSQVSGLLRLVDYGSSDDSDPEDMEVSDGPQDPGRGNIVPGLCGSVQTPDLIQEFTVQSVSIPHQSPSAVQTQTEHESSDSASWTRTGSSLRLDSRTSGFYPIMTQSGHMTCPQMTSGQIPCPEVTSRQKLCPQDTSGQILGPQVTTGHISCPQDTTGQMSCPRVTRSGPSPCPGGEVSIRVVSCLSELRGVVSRLQVKKLFPYNATSLLKLLAQVENCCQYRGLLQ